MGHIVVSCLDKDSEIRLVMVLNTEVKPEDKLLVRVFGSNLQPKPEWGHVINKKDGWQKPRMINPPSMKWED
jgi:hypothetical protein